MAPIESRSAAIILFKIDTFFFIGDVLYCFVKNEILTPLTIKLT